MKTVRLPIDLATRFGYERTVVAFGVFDGVHVGHRRILERVCKLAALHQAVPTVVTFDPHPRHLLSHTPPPLLLTPLPQKLRLLAACGIEATVLLPFDNAMAALSPDDFLKAYVFTREPPKVTAICIGSEWRFGHKGTGTVADLKAFAEAHDCSVESIPEVSLDGAPVSSTRIRKAIRSGRLDEARALLGRDVTVTGTIRRGKGIGGQRFGCPTANIDADGVVLPPDGVYAARGDLQGSGRALPGICYVGKAPTISHAGGGASRVVEIHLFDIDQTLYGQDIDVTFLTFLRTDRTFEGEQQLKQQIDADIIQARQLLDQA